MDTSTLYLHNGLHNICITGCAAVLREFVYEVQGRFVIDRSHAVQNYS